MAGWKQRLWRLQIAMRGNTMLNSGNPLPDVATGTARLHARVIVQGAVLHAGRVYEVRGIDLERDIPRLRLADGQLVDATTLVANERSAGMVRGSSGGGSAFVRPGAAPAAAAVAEGTRVTVVARWATAVGGAQTLARWCSDAGELFGVFAERDLDDGR